MPASEETRTGKRYFLSFLVVSNICCCFRTTLLGHQTGAALVQFLMQSPAVVPGECAQKVSAFVLPSSGLPSLLSPDGLITVLRKSLKCNCPDGRGEGVCVCSKSEHMGCGWRRSLTDLESHSPPLYTMVFLLPAAKVDQSSITETSLSLPTFPEN